MDEILVQKIIDRIDSLEKNMNTRMDKMQEEINGIHNEMDGMHNEMNGMHDEMDGMHNEIREIKENQRNMQHDIRGLQQGQHIIIRAVTETRNDVTQLKRETIKLSERIEANSMDIETVDNKAEKIRRLVKN